MQRFEELNSKVLRMLIRRCNHKLILWVRLQLPRYIVPIPSLEFNVVFSTTVPTRLKRKTVAATIEQLERTTSLRERHALKVRA